MHGLSLLQTAVQLLLVGQYVLGRGTPVFHNGDVVSGSTTGSVNPICLTSEDTLIPHDTKCALYYNCSADAQKSYWEKNLHECPHPQVYNNDTRRCEHYTMVNCGQREMPLGHCDYMLHQCARGHCVPCDYYYASCKNAPDGLNVHTYRMNSPYYIVCVDQRLVYEGQCPRTADDRVQIFDPDIRWCVPA